MKIIFLYFFNIKISKQLKNTKTINKIIKRDFNSKTNNFMYIRNTKPLRFIHLLRSQGS